MKPVVHNSTELKVQEPYFGLFSQAVQFNSLAVTLCMADSLQRLQVLTTYTTFIILDVHPLRMSRIKLNDPYVK